MEVIIVSFIVSFFIFYKLLTYLNMDEKQKKIVETVKIEYSEETLISLSDIIDALEVVISLLDTALSYLGEAVSSGIIDRMDDNIFLNIGKYEALEIAQTHVQKAQGLMDEIQKEASCIMIENKLSISLIEVLNDVILENKLMKDISLYKISKHGKKLLKQQQQIVKTRNKLVLQYNECIRKNKTR